MLVRYRNNLYSQLTNKRSPPNNITFRQRRRELELLLTSLSAVLGTALLTVCNALSVKRTADDVVTYTRQVTYTSASDENYGVLLQVVADTGNVGSSLKTVGKSYSGDLTERGVRLLRACGRYLGAYASFLGRRLIDRCIVKSVKALLRLNQGFLLRRIRSAAPMRTWR